MAPVFKHGRNAYLNVSNMNSATFVISSGADEITLDRTLDTAEVSSFGDNDKAFLAGLRGATLSVSGHFSSTHAENLDVGLGASTNPTLHYGPYGNTTGFHRLNFSAIMTGVSYGSPVNDKVSLNATFTVTGAVTSTNF